MFKRFFEYALMGAGTCIGYLSIKKGIDIMTDPYKKAKIKKKIKNVKQAITEKVESWQGLFFFLKNVLENA